MSAKTRGHGGRGKKFGLKACKEKKRTAKGIRESLKQARLHKR